MKSIYIVSLIHGVICHRMWKFHQIALEMVSLIIRHDVPVPQRIVNLFVSNVNHDSLNVRKVGV